MAEDVRELSYAEALREAAAAEMARDPAVFVLGQGVDDSRGVQGTTLDLHRLYGRERCFDTPVAEEAMTGVAVGAALAGLRPIHVHRRMDFLLLCMNQLVNVAAKLHYLSAGRLRVPLTVRAAVGRGWGQGAQHAQALHAMFMHVPGLKVLAPSTPHDAKGALIAAIRDDNPVIVMEHRLLYGMRGPVPAASYALPFGTVRVAAEGEDITLVAISHMVSQALLARDILAEHGVRATVIDPVSLAPLDIGGIVRSVGRTGHLLVIDNGWPACGAGAEIIAGVVEHLRAAGLRLARLGFAPTPCPTAPALEAVFYPSPLDIARRALALLGAAGDTRRAGADPI